MSKWETYYDYTSYFDPWNMNMVVIILVYIYKEFFQRSVPSENTRWVNFFTFPATGTEHECILNSG